MKQLNYLLILLLIVGFVACKGNPKKKLIGTWQLESVEGETLSDAEKSMKLNFKEDGSMEQSMGEMKRGGKWTVSEDGKKLTLTPEGDKDEVMNVEKVDAKQLVVTDSKSKKVTLKKI